MLFLTFCLSVLENLICHIVRVGSQEQVSRIDAGRVITTMQDTLTSRNYPVVYFPRNAVSASAATLCLQYSIAKFVFHANPDPALAMDWMDRSVLVNVGPEAVNMISKYDLPKRVAVPIPVKVMPIAPASLVAYESGTAFNGTKTRWVKWHDGTPSVLPRGKVRQAGRVPALQVASLAA